jgi:Mce-associated membrane protein
MTVKRPPTRRPRVAGHNRRTESPTVAEVLEEEEVPPPPSSSSEEPPVVDEDVDDEVVVRPRSRLPLILVVVAAVLVGLGTFFLVKANSVDRGGDTRALTEVNGQVRADLQKVFSFSYDKLDETTQAARQVLAGSAVDQYNKLIETVRAQAPAQKLVLATRVTSAGVKSLDTDHAELLVFLDQVATRVDTGKTSGSAAALTVRAERQGDTWKIVELIPR